MTTTIQRTDNTNTDQPADHYRETDAHHSATSAETGRLEVFRFGHTAGCNDRVRDIHGGVDDRRNDAPLCGKFGANLRTKARENVTEILLAR